METPSRASRAPRAPLKPSPLPPGGRAEANSLSSVGAEHHQPASAGRSRRRKATAEELLQRCMARLKRQREQDIAERRGLLLSSLVHEEFESMQADAGAGVGVGAGASTSADGGNDQAGVFAPTDEDMRVIEEEVQQSILERLLREEQETLSEMEMEILRLEHERLQRLERDQTEDELSKVLESLDLQDGVLCPVCGHGHVHLSNAVFFCACGMRVDASMNPLSLDQFRERLGSIFSRHSLSHCRERPVGEVRGGLLVLACQACGLFEVAV